MKQNLSPKALLKVEKNIIRDGKNILMIWPLIASCSFKVKNENEGFTPEYIIPKHLLEWVRIHKNLDGIKFISTKSEEKHLKNNGSLVNYVVPVKKVLEKGHCTELASKIKVTESISWEVLNLINQDIIDFNKKFENTFKFDYNYKLHSLELIKGRPQMYWKTAFGQLEYQLNEMELNHVK